MNRKVKGLLVGIGVGVVSGLGFLLMRGEKTQRFMRERWQQLRSALPEPEHVQLYVRQVTNRLSRGSSDAKDTTQQAMRKVPEAIKRTGQDIASKTRQMAGRS
jgi:gas vesicle protein